MMATLVNEAKTVFKSTMCTTSSIAEEPPPAIENFINFHISACFSVHLTKGFFFLSVLFSLITAP